MGNTTTSRQARLQDLVSTGLRNKRSRTSVAFYVARDARLAIPTWLSKDVVPKVAVRGCRSDDDVAPMSGCRSDEWLSEYVDLQVIGMDSQKWTGSKVAHAAMASS